MNPVIKKELPNQFCEILNRVIDRTNDLDGLNKTLEEINKIREEKRKELDLRVNTKLDTREKHILVCHGTGCTSSNSIEILENLTTEG